MILSKTDDSYRNFLHTSHSTYRGILKETKAIRETLCYYQDNPEFGLLLIQGSVEKIFLLFSEYRAERIKMFTRPTSNKNDKNKGDNMHFEKISYEQWYKDCDMMDNPHIAGDILENVLMPKRATKGSAGYDFYCPYDVTIPPHSAQVIHTGMRWVCGENERDRVLLIAPRSSTGFKTGVRLMNTLGIIDSDYCDANNEGHIAIKLYNPQDEPLEIKTNQAFVQGFIVPFMVCDDDNAEGDRIGGFGSTDK